MKKLFLLLIFLSLTSFSCAQSGKHPYFIEHLQISKTGRYVLAGRLDNKIVVWDIKKKKQLYTWASTKEHHFSWQAHFTPDEKYVVIQQNNFDLWFISLETGEVEKIYPLPAQATTIAFYKDGNRFIWGGIDGRIVYENMEKKNSKILKIPLDRESNIWPGFAGPINKVILAQDEKKFATSTFYSDYYDLFDEKGEPYYLIKESNFYFIKHINLNLWDAQTLEKKHRLRAEYMDGKNWVCFSPDSKTIYASSENAGAYAWDCETGKIKFPFTMPMAYDGIGLLGNGEYFCGLSVNQRKINLMSTKDGSKIYEIKVKREPIFGQLITYDKDNIVILGCTDGSIDVYKFEEGSLSLKLLWHPKPVKRGIITWIGPNYTFGKTPEQIKEMREKYIKKQKELGFE